MAPSDLAVRLAMNLPADLPLAAGLDAPDGALRSAFGRFATGVTIVTCRDAQLHRVGLTVNSFASLSLEPPLVLWSLRRASPSVGAFAAATHFAINVLALEQVDLSRRFASGELDKFGAGRWLEGASGVPVLDDCVAVFECRLESQQDVGDHVLFIGRVLRMCESARAPLVYRSGHYHDLGQTL